MMLTDLADVLRSAGLKVVEVGGWKTRSNDGNRFAGVQGILCHWTGTALTAQGSYPSLNVVTNGRSDLPGMLSQLGLGRDGVWYVIGAGVAWHAGSVDQQASDNYHAIGIEAEYHPDQGAWPDVQQRSYERGCAALARHYSVPNSRIRGHYEAAIPYGRKPDPRTLPGGMPGFRQRVAAVNLEEDDVSFEEPLTSHTGYTARASEWVTMTSSRVEDVQGVAYRLEAKLDLLTDTVEEGQVELLAEVRLANDPATPTDYERLGKSIAANLPAPTGGVTAEDLERELLELFGRVYRLGGAA